jgi:hypothetical protein
MDRTLRCTVCTWRGTWSDASVAPPVRASLPDTMLDIQRAYEEKQLASARFGMTREPPCPRCGHHTISVRLTPSFHSSM